jgi:hypothetical protein
MIRYAVNIAGWHLSSTRELLGKVWIVNKVGNASQGTQIINIRLLNTVQLKSLCSFWEHVKHGDMLCGKMLFLNAAVGETYMMLMDWVEAYIL